MIRLSSTAHAVLARGCLVSRKKRKKTKKAQLEIKCLSWFESTPRATPAFTTIVATHRGAVQEDVDILIRRADFDRVKVALESVGFIHHELMGIDCFIDGPDGSPRDAVHILYAAEKVRPEYIVASADVTEIETADDYDVVNLRTLLAMKLNSFRDRDRRATLGMRVAGQ